MTLGGAPVMFRISLVWSSVMLASALPELEYKYTSFATPSPTEAAKFMSRYFGAAVLEPSQFITHHGSNASVEGVRFTTHANVTHDVYFVDDKISSELLTYFHETHRFDLQEHWDWFMDWHLCFNVDDFDLAAHRLVADGVPIVTRSSSFYVEVPDGITVQFLSSGTGGHYYWTEAFNFCRTTVRRFLFPATCARDR